MAVYHLRAQNISRGQGRGVVAAAAYRHGAVMFDDRTGKTHSYEGRQDVLHSEFALPADAPAWVKDLAGEAGSAVRASEDFWNRLNAFERRSNARLAREIEFSLPAELTREQNIALVREFVSQAFLNEGMVADWAYHDKQGNPHVHVMLTLRPLTEDGFGPNWLPVLDPVTGEQLRSGSGKLRYERWAGDVERLIAYRKVWAEVQNRHLAMAGVEARVTHESYRSQGIVVEPTTHVGVHASALRHAGKATVERDRLSPEAKATNRDLFLADPGTVLKIITREKSVFDERDVARTIHRLVDDPEAFAVIRLRVLACPELVELTPRLMDAETDQELQRARYTTAELLDIETRMMARAVELREAGGYGVADPFVQGAIASKPFLASDQRDAIRSVTGSERMAAVVGFAGAGKSTMLAAAREAWEAQGFHVHGAALAGKAAEGLERSSGIRSRTLASWELGWSKGYDRLGAGDILVIDEAGMVASRQMERFVSAAREAGAKLVLVGDAAQLQPIEAGAAFRAITEEIGYAELTGVRRQREDWAREASVSFAQGRVADALDAYAGRGFIRFDETRETARATALQGWMEDRAQGGSTLILAHTNADVYALNEGARARLKALGDLGGECSFLTARGTRRFAEGDRVLFLENDRTLGVKNGMLGTVAEAQPGRLVVSIDTKSEAARTVAVDQRSFNNIDWGYAATIHKSQGATVDRVRVLAAPSMDRHLAYVAMSRHRESVVLHAGRDDWPDIVALTRNLSRSGAKEVSTDYLKGRPAERFAERRGVVTWREVMPAFLTFARTQAAWIAAARETVGNLWTRAEAARQRTSAAHEAARPSLRTVPKTTEDALRVAADRAARRSKLAAQSPANQAPQASSAATTDAATRAAFTILSTTDAPSQEQPTSSPAPRPSRPTPRVQTTEDAVRVARQRQAHRDAALRRLASSPSSLEPSTAPVENASPQAPEAAKGEPRPVLIAPLRAFAETVSLVAKTVTMSRPDIVASKAELADMAATIFREPEPIMSAIAAALDREPDDFARSIGQVVTEVAARGGLHGKTGLFASRADKATFAMSLGRSGSFKAHAETLHRSVHERRAQATRDEERRRQRLQRAIPKPSRDLEGTLHTLGRAPPHEHRPIVAQALRDPVLGRELWGFAKAVEERFMEPLAKSGKPVPAANDPPIEAGLSQADRARISELEPLLESGKIAARQIRAVEARRQDQRLEQKLARTLDLTQDQDLSPGF